MKTGESRLLKHDLSNYDASSYEKVSLTVDIGICSIIDDELKILLINRKYLPFKDYWAIPGGFLKNDLKETLEETAIRKLKEETGLKDIYIEQLKSYGDPYRDPRMRIISVAYFALVPYSFLEKQKIKWSNDVQDAQWFSVRNLPNKIAFDHEIIVKDILLRLIGKISYSPIAFSLLPDKFTWMELQRVYEIILGKKLLASNFRRKLNTMYEFKTVKICKSNKPGRPSTCISFIKEKEY